VAVERQSASRTLIAAIQVSMENQMDFPVLGDCIGDLTGGMASGQDTLKA
jgi:hypothetical protein